MCTGIQRQAAITVCLKSKQLLFAVNNYRYIPLYICYVMTIDIGVCILKNTAGENITYSYQSKKLSQFHNTPSVSLGWASVVFTQLAVDIKWRSVRPDLLQSELDRLVILKNVLCTLVAIILHNIKLLIKLFPDI